MSNPFVSIFPDVLTLRRARALLLEELRAGAIAAAAALAAALALHFVAMAAAGRPLHPGATLRPLATAAIIGGGVLGILRDWALHGCTLRRVAAAALALWASLATCGAQLGLADPFAPTDARLTLPLVAALLLAPLATRVGRRDEPAPARAADAHAPRR